MKPGAKFTPSIQLGVFKPHEPITVGKVDPNDPDGVRIDFTNSQGQNDSFWFDPEDELDID